MAAFPYQAKYWGASPVREVHAKNCNLTTAKFGGGSTVREAHAKNCNLTTAKFGTEVR